MFSGKTRKAGFEHFWQGVQILKGSIEIPPHREGEFFRCPECKKLRYAVVAAMPCTWCKKE